MDELGKNVLSCVNSCFLLVCLVCQKACFVFDPKVKPGARSIEVGGRIQAKYEIRRND